MRLAILLLLSLCARGPYVLAQQVKVGVSAGLVRSFIYPQGFSTSSPYDFVQAHGQWGYLVAAKAQRAISRTTALEASVRLVRTPATYNLLLVVPEAFQVMHRWSARRRTYQLSTGVSHRVTERCPQVRVFGGLFTGVETQRWQIMSTGVAAYQGGGFDLTLEELEYATPAKLVWLAGAEAGVGLRVLARADLNLRYNYHFTPTAGTAYSSLLLYSDPPGSPRRSTGTIKGRATFAAAEIVIWIN